MKTPRRILKGPFRSSWSWRGPRGVPVASSVQSVKVECLELNHLLGDPPRRAVAPLRESRSVGLRWVPLSLNLAAKAQRMEPIGQENHLLLDLWEEGVMWPV